MDAHDAFPEERIGTLAMIRKRAAEIEAVAEACDAEAEEQAQAVVRLRERARRLRGLAEEYTVAAHMADTQQQSQFDPADPYRPTGVFMVDEFSYIPQNARPDDVVLVRSQFDPMTFRRYAWNEIDQTWRRARP